MPQPVDINGKTIQYPIVGESEWGVEATDFAVQVAAALAKIGQSTPPATNNITIPSGNLTVTTGNTDLGGTLDVTGATTLDSTLTVAGTTTLNGNTNLGNANTDTIAVTGILNVDSGTLYVNPTDNRVGINDSSPSEALDVTGNALVSGTLGVTGAITGASATLTDLTVDTNLIKTNSTSNFVGINTTSPTVALDVTGDVKQSGVLLNADGTVSSPSITFTNDTNTGLYRIGADEIGVTTNGVQRTKIGSYGVYTSGSIVQVTSTTKTDTFSTTSLSFVDITGLSVSITPKFTTSRILIIVSVAKGSSADDTGGFELRRDSTSIAIADSGGGIRSSMAAYYGGTAIGVQLNTLSLTHLDSPSTNSAITYSLRGRQQTGGTLWINRNSNDSWRAVSSITAMELAA
jgi:hypothetical protein